jgi:hypothetical protein
MLIKQSLRRHTVVCVKKNSHGGSRVEAASRHVIALLILIKITIHDKKQRLHQST